MGSEHDISPDFKWLFDFLAGKAAEKRWREMGARSVMEAKTVFRTSYRRQIGIALERSSSQLTFDRLNLVLYGPSNDAGRQRAYEAHSQNMEEEYYNRHGPSVD